MNLAPARGVDMKGAKGVIRGETWRWKKWISWGGGEGGDGAAGVAGEADGFEIVHFGGSVSGSASDSPFKEGDAVGGEGGLAFVESAIGLETNSSVSSCCVARG